MEQFLVPQFIDVEDKILGPITTRQFVLMLGGGLLLFILYKLLPFAYFIVVGILVILAVALLAFAKVNGRPVHFFLLNFLQTSKRPKLRIWNKAAYVRDVKVKYEAQKEIVPPPIKDPIIESRLIDLSLLINSGGAYVGESSFETAAPVEKKPVAKNEIKAA